MPEKAFQEIQVNHHENIWVFVEKRGSFLYDRISLHKA